MWQYGFSKNLGAFKEYEMGMSAFLTEIRELQLPSRSKADAAWEHAKAAMQEFFHEVDGMIREDLKEL